MLPIAYRLAPNAYCLLPIAYCILPYCPIALKSIAYCPSARLPDCHIALLPYCLLATDYCLLPFAYCLLPIAYCPLLDNHRSAEGDPSIKYLAIVGAESGHKN